jgi:hypothetical protein
MQKSLFFEYRASRAETALLFLYAVALSGIRKTKRNLFFTVNKTRAHPTETEPDPFFPVHSHRFFPFFHVYLNIVKRGSVEKLFARRRMEQDKETPYLSFCGQSFTSESIGFLHGLNCLIPDFTAENEDRASESWSKTLRVFSIPRALMDMES